MAHGLHFDPAVEPRPLCASGDRTLARDLRRRARQRGFTLIEMAIVVIIVAILSVLAVVGYRKIILSSHTAEGVHMVQAIKVAQESYRAETQVYADISPDLDTTYPAATPLSSFKTVWGGACGSQCNASPKPTWLDLPVHVDGPVMFGYATTAGVAGQAPRPLKISPNGKDLTFPNPSQTDWFVIAARVDQTTPPNGIYCHVYATSWTTDIYIDRDSE